MRQKEILRAKDFYIGAVTRPETEDLLRDTLITVAKDELNWDVTAIAAAQPGRPLIDISTAEIGSTTFSKYKLAKAFLHWLSTHT